MIIHALFAGMEGCMAVRRLGVAFALFACLFMVIGGFLAYGQHRKITTFLPVEASIVSSSIVEHHGKATAYSPAVEFRYSVEGRSYTANTPLILPQSSGREWAARIVGNYPPGKIVRAYYNPRAPYEAFLLRQVQFFPYGIILFPMSLVAIGIGVAAAGGAVSISPSAPVMRADGWFALSPTASIAGHRRTAAAVFAAWYGVGILACGHYFWLAEPPYGAAVKIAMAVYAVIGLIPAGALATFFLLGRNVGDAGICVNTAMFFPGSGFSAGFQQLMLNPLVVEEVSVGLICRKTTRTSHGSKATYSTSVCHESWTKTLQNYQARAGELLQSSCALAVPAGEHPSSARTSRSYPQYTWCIAVTTKLADSPDYSAEFPIFVAKSAEGAAARPAGSFKARMKRMLVRA